LSPDRRDDLPKPGLETDERSEDQKIRIYKPAEARTMLVWSIVVCCYNSETRIRETLCRILESVHRRAAGSVEIVVVDNACTDDTAGIAKETAAKKSFRFLKVVREDRPGLMHARIAGVRAASGKYIAFMDDDNWPCERYFDIAEATFDNNAQVGVFGCASTLPPGQCIPEPLEKYGIHFAVGRQPFKPGQLAPCLYVWGAGMAVRRSRLKAVLDAGFDPVLIGRSKTQQFAGDDTELVSVMALAGSTAWYENQPLITHAVDSTRFCREKLRTMFEGFGASTMFIDKYSLSIKGVPVHYPLIFILLTPFIFVKDIFLVAMSALKNVAVGLGDFDFELRTRLIFTKWRFYFGNPRLRSVQRENIARIIFLRKAGSARVKPVLFSNGGPKGFPKGRKKENG
jgi:glycosyltransferase involved in cell wall biosynthesis